MAPRSTQSPRPTNPELCAAFRALLTSGFYTVDPAGEIWTDDPDDLQATKPWRGDLWKAFRELEDRLCPTLLHARTKSSASPTP